MAQESVTARDTLFSIFNRTSVFITYVPLRTEVPFEKYLSLPQNAEVHEIPARAALDPFQEAEKTIRAAGVKETCVFLPGRRFDAAGTRFGQGGGWYDRFLSKIPSTWMRVGFCFDTQFSKELLARQPWDQAMDFIGVVDKNDDTFTVYETKARGMLDLKS